ncbi:iron complex outermembrane receptor protein [Filimonas zeae]|nr:TonB-dependent receptor [Filimonas zeae]MDR6342773.1 iron complex outermembrane receptor protein [Filimonas zeae]
MTKTTCIPQLLGLFFIALFPMLLTAQQNGTIKGAVTTSDGKGAYAVSLLLQKTGRAAVTDATGHFTIKNVKPGTYDLAASLLGYADITQKVTVQSGQTSEVAIQLALSDLQLQEIIVKTARNKYNTAASDYVGKMNLKNLENAQSYSTVSKELMNQQSVFSVSDAVKNVPGVMPLWESVGRAGTGGAYYAQRGFATQPKARNGLAGNTITDVDVANIERVEVIKGPSGTLFGNNITSYGGLINMVTKSPYNHLGGEIQYSGGGYGLHRLSADINTPVDAEGKLLFRLNTAFVTQNTFQDYGFRKIFNVSPSLSYQVNDKLSFNLDAEFQSGQAAGGAQVIYFVPPSQYQNTVVGLLSRVLTPAQIAVAMQAYPKTVQEAYGVNRADQLKLNYQRSFYSNDLVNETRVANIYGQMNYKLSGQWSSQTNISRNNNSSEGYMPFFYLMPNFVPAFVRGISTGAVTFGTPGADNLARMVWKPVGNQNAIEMQQNFLGDFSVGNMRNRFTGGLNYYNYNYNITYNGFVGSLYGLPYQYAFDVAPVNDSFPRYTDFNKAKVDSAFAAGRPYHYTNNLVSSTYSAYFNDVLNITENLLVNVGLRIDHFNNKGSLNPDNGKYYNGYKQTALSPKFGIVYQVIKNQVSVFGNYQNGFTNVNGQDFNRKPFRPEQANQWEGGVKLNMWDGKVSGTISYYDIKVKDMVRVDPNPDHIGFSIQDGSQKSKGFEADITLLPVAGLNITAGYAYNDSKYINTSADLDGLRPITSGARNAVNFWAGYQFTTGKAQGLGFGFGGNYVGDCYAVNSRANGEFILPAYTVFNGTAFYDQPRFRLSAKLNNIGNKQYWIGYSTMDPQMLRQFVASVAFKF